MTIKTYGGVPLLADDPVGEAGDEAGPHGAGEEGEGEVEERREAQQRGHQRGHQHGAAQRQHPQPPPAPGAHRPAAIKTVRADVLFTAALLSRHHIYKIDHHINHGEILRKLKDKQT